ncbi:MAG TPA: SoxR reducing system RseC family protein [Chitinispirillaceae bacterium]|nr:SoxR reducing system RseC family protein [Chitinispirillaceae bacterium]
MMIHSEKKAGTITRKDRNRLWVEIDQGCDTSASRCAAGCGGCSGSTSQRKAMISSADPEKYSVGQKIEFMHVSLNENLVALIVFGIPISSAFLTLVLWYLISPSTVETPVSFLSAAAALLGGFTIVNWIDSWFRSKFPSRILSTISSEITVRQ